MTEGKPRYVRLKAVPVEEKEGRRLIVGVNDIDAQVRQEENYVDHLAQAKIEANVDPLTGVKNRHAYRLAEERMNAQIAEDPGKEFAVTILDVNDLKKINDREGHSAGDQHLREACRIVCKVFKHSPVFRIGGDEFSVVLRNSDYDDRDDLIRTFEQESDSINASCGNPWDQVHVSMGIAVYNQQKDHSVIDTVRRADKAMYTDKRGHKNAGG